MSAQTLAAFAIKRCKKGAAPMTVGEYTLYLQQLPQWHVTLINGISVLTRDYACPSFASALQLTNRIGELAETADHHPALLTEWGKVTVSWWTHKIGGLHLNDFIMAARCDEVFATIQ